MSADRHPGLCVEVLCTDRAVDTVVTATKYAGRGVEHYWIVDLERTVVQVFVLDEGGYRLAQTVDPGAPAEVDFGCTSRLDARSGRTDAARGRGVRPSANGGLPLDVDRVTPPAWRVSSTC